MGDGKGFTETAVEQVDLTGAHGNVPAYNGPQEVSDEEEEQQRLDAQMADVMAAQRPDGSLEDAMQQMRGRRQRAGDIPPIRASQFVNMSFRMPNPHTRELEPFSFAGRRHMFRLYDTPSNRVLLCCARQTEKCEYIGNTVSMANGFVTVAGNIELGDSLACMEMLVSEDQRTTSGKVTWVSPVIEKPCVRIVTRQGHEMILGVEHPVRAFNRWVPARDVTVGMRVASVRRCGEFRNVPQPVERIELIAMLLGDGSLSSTISFSQNRGVLLDRYLELLSRLSGY